MTQGAYGSDLENGWRLEGTDGAGRPIRILIGEMELSRTYLGVTVGRHPLLCERVVEDPSVSRRHFRIGRGGSGIFIEDVHSLNGTYVDGEALKPFEPIALTDGQSVVAGRVTLSVHQLADQEAS